MNRPARTALELGGTAVAGFLAFIAPVILSPPTRLPSAPLFPIVRAAVEEPSMLSFAGLAAVGLIAGIIFRAPWYLLGLATMSLFPLCTFLEMGADPTSHNLFPFEFVMYGIFTIPALIAAGIARGVRPSPRPQLGSA